MSVSILPSVLDVPRDEIQQYIDDIEPLVDGISFDIMDGDFVPPVSFTLDEVALYEVRKLREIHLMVQNPEEWLDECFDMGADIIAIHVEARQRSVLANLQLIQEEGIQSCLALKPGTGIADVDPQLWDHVDVALIMSVEPGWGGQSFMPEVLDKVAWLSEHYPEMDINIDGGISDQTAPLALDAGCTFMVSGSYLYKAEDRSVAVALLRGE